MAQSVEQLIRNQQVAGSSPASSSILKRAASRNRLAALFTGFRPTFHRRSGAAFSFLSFFFRAASPVTRLPCFAFYFCLVKRYSVANASPSPRIYRSFCFLLLTSPTGSSILKRAASRNRLVALFTGFCPTFHRRSGAAFSFLSFFFRAASPVTRLPCFAFYFCLVKRYSVANASPSPRIYRSFCFLLLTSPASSSILKRRQVEIDLPPFYGLLPDLSPPKRRGVFVFIFFLPRRIADDAFPLLRFLLLRRQTLFRRKRFLFRPTARFYFRRVVYKNCLFFR